MCFRVQIKWVNPSERYFIESKIKGVKPVDVVKI